MKDKTARSRAECRPAGRRPASPSGAGHWELRLGKSGASKPPRPWALPTRRQVGSGGVTGVHHRRRACRKSLSPGPRPGGAPNVKAELFGLEFRSERTSAEAGRRLPSECLRLKAEAHSVVQRQT